MDDFGIDRHELDGSLITLEFGASGRIIQLWAADPSLPRFAGRVFTYNEFVTVASKGAPGREGSA